MNRAICCASVSVRLGRNQVRRHCTRSFRAMAMLFALTAVTVVHGAIISFSNGGEGESQMYQQGFGTYDLTSQDITINFTLDLSGITANDIWSGPYAMVGLRDQGQNVAVPAQGHGGWITGFTPDYQTTDPNALDGDDKFNLSNVRGNGEAAYDATDPDTITDPFGTFNSKGFWFDRDGVDPWQNDEVANTGGLYDVTVKYHLANETQGTMFAVINGVTQGFDTTSGDGFNIDTDPAGLSFSAADFSALELYAGAEFWDGGAGEILVKNLAVVEGASGLNPTLDDQGTEGLGTSGIGVGVEGKTDVPVSLDVTMTLDSDEVANALEGQDYISVQMYYSESELSEKEIDETTLRLYWWDGTNEEWIAGGTTTDGVIGEGVFAGLNSSPGDYGLGYHGISLSGNYVWANINHASPYGVGGLMVPEPSSALLAMLGIAAGLVHRRRMSQSI